jgi:hypothetical protein
MYNKQDEELDKEIEALENQIFNTPGEESGEEIAEEVSKVEEKEVVVNTVAVDYEKRFNNYKASTDVTIRDLRADLANQKIRYANLQKNLIDLTSQLREAKGSSSSNIFTEDEVDILGESAANALDKGVKAMLDSKIKPLEEELERNRKESADRSIREAQEVIKGRYTDFLSKLGKLVPDYETINVSPGFLQYMKDVDTPSGMPRSKVFEKAEEALDVWRVASFFTDYSKTIKIESLEDAVNPTGSAGSPSSTSKIGEGKDSTVVTSAFIDKFYEDYSKGKYKTKKGREEAARIEAIIDKAVFSGNVK